MSIIYKFKFKNKNAQTWICHQAQAEASTSAVGTETGNCDEKHLYSKRKTNSQMWHISSRREISLQLSLSSSAIKSTLIGMISGLSWE